MALTNPVSIRPFELNGRWSYGGCVHDLSRWPLLMIKMPSRGSDETWKALLARVEHCLSDPWRAEHGYLGKYVTLLDISEVTENNAQRRREWDALVDRYEPVIERDSLGMAVVLTSAVGRYIYTAVTWLEAARGKERSPHQVFATLPEAEVWCSKRLLEAGLTPHESLQRFSSRL